MGTGRKNNGAALGAARGAASSHQQEMDAAENGVGQPVRRPVVLELDVEAVLEADLQAVGRGRGAADAAVWRQHVPTWVSRAKRTRVVRAVWRGRSGEGKEQSIKLPAPSLTGGFL